MCMCICVAAVPSLAGAMFMDCNDRMFHALRQWHCGSAVGRFCCQ